MCGVLMCMNVWVQVCAPHMWTTSDVSQSLGAFHLLFEIRSDIALELYHIGQALWLTHFQGSPWEVQLGLQSLTTMPGFLYGFWKSELRPPHLRGMCFTN